MLSPDLIQTLQSLSQDDKQKVVDLLTSALKADDPKQERKKRVEQLSQEILQEHKGLFERLAKGVDE